MSFRDDPDGGAFGPAGYERGGGSDGQPRSTGVYRSSATGDSGSVRSSGTVYGGGSGGGGTVYGGGGGASSGSASVSGGGGTVYGGSAGGTVYGSGGATGGSTGGGGTVYGGNTGGTVYGSGSASGSVPVSGAARASGTVYGGSGGHGTVYGAGAPGSPAGIGPRSRAAALDGDDELFPALGGGVPPHQSNSAELKKARRKKILRITGLVTGVVMLLGIAVSGVSYAVTELPQIPTTSQRTTLVYSDGKTELAGFATENRVEVKLEQVPKHVQDAVVAAEDAGFWDRDGGVSITGTGRAVWGLVTGDENAGGGSTITQQYVRNALDLDRGRNYGRKAREIILAQKLSQNKTKEQILEGYLNTILFGRGAWGIQAASKAYFSKTVDKLTLAEGVVLAAAIKDPTNFDPANKPESAKGRWEYLLNLMVEKGFLSQEDRQKQTYPTTAKPGAGKEKWRQDDRGVLAAKIEQELKTKVKLTEQEIYTGGYRVVTTVSPRAQDAARKAAKAALQGQDERMASALVSIDPRSGAVRAYYGGDRGYGNLDLAGKGAPHPAGSSFKPYVLVAGLEEGYGIDSLWDGTTGQEFEDRANPLHNSERDNSCGKQCSLTKATVKSLNTVYWALTLAVGAKDVAALAERAGIKTLDGKPTMEKANEGINSGIGIGQYSVTVLDQAAGYATFANYGTYREPYFIERVLDSSGVEVWSNKEFGAAPVEAFSRDSGRDASYVMQQVYKASQKKIRDGRAAAGKTGTQQYKNTDDNAHAWMCGYTPQLATAVWVGSGTNDFALRDKANGNIRVYGSGLPATIWRSFMSTALSNADKESFEDPVRKGDKNGNAPTAEPDPTPTPDESDGENGSGDPNDPGWPWNQGEPSTDPTAEPTEDPGGFEPPFPDDDGQDNGGFGG